MPAQNDPPSGSKPGAKIEKINVTNYLRARVGASSRANEEGYIAPEAIEEADKLISALCVDCPATIGGLLKDVTGVWTKMQTAKDHAESQELSQQMFTLAHEIKDVSAMCQFTLLSYFAESLRDYIGQTELNLQAQIVITQAHIDAMQIVHKKGVKTDAGPEAEELKKMVKKAIDKYK